MAPLLQVKNLKTYFYTDDGVVKAVDGVSFDLEEGETLGLVGESGCGKSVSALSLMRLVPSPPGRIVEGEILFNGVDLLRLGSEEMRRHRGKDIAMIFQEPMTSLNPVLTIGRQITEALELHLKMGKRASVKRAGELLKEVGISDPGRRLSDYPHQFSGGMRQRVMIAMALSCEPKILLADEPTTAVDVTIQAQLLELIATLTRERKTAVVLITHNLGVVARYADRVNIMYAGRVVERSTAAKVYSSPRHPYTLGLLRSVPRLDEARGERLIPIEGVPPDLALTSPGCVFRPRCPFAIRVCEERDPELIVVDEMQEAACWVDIRRSSDEGS